MSKLPTSCDRLMDGAKDAGVECDLLTEEETRTVVDRVFDTHFPTQDRSGYFEGRGWIWDTDVDEGSVSFRLFMGEIEEDWNQFKHLVSSWPAGEVFVFFEWRDSKIGLRFESMDDLMSSVRESISLDDMYMTDTGSRGLACLNHHDYLILWGEAVGWAK